MTFPDRKTLAHSPAEQERTEEPAPAPKAAGAAGGTMVTTRAGIRASRWAQTCRSCGEHYRRWA